MWPLIQVLTVLIEYLDAAVRSISHVDPALPVNVDRVG
jgi:hypothetical protein